MGLLLHRGLSTSYGRLRPRLALHRRFISQLDKTYTVARVLTSGGFGSFRLLLIISTISFPSSRRSRSMSKWGRVHLSVPTSSSIHLLSSNALASVRCWQYLSSASPTRRNPSSSTSPVSQVFVKIR